MKNKLGSSLAPASALFAIALALVPVAGYCDWFSYITEILGSKGKGMNTNINADEASHIKVVREVTLEIGRAPTPHAMAQTKDGGYVIAGAVWVPWATRVGANGNVVWRYELSAYNPSAPKEGKGHYNGTAILSDDSAILCGEMGLPPSSEKRVGDVVGMLTHLDKAGLVLSHQLLYPNGDKDYSLSRLDKCVPWGDGVAVVGHASRFPKQGGIEESVWLIALDGNGSIKWEKTFSRARNSDVVVMPNQELLTLFGFERDGAIWEAEAIRLGKNGEIKSQRTNQVFGKLVTPIVAEPVLRQLSVSSHNQSAAVKTLSEQGEEMESVQFEFRPLSPEQIYLMPNHDFALFGTEYGPKGGEGPSASITWLSADLRKSETFTFRNKSYSAGIADAMPTGKPGEFVTVRRAFEISKQDKRQAVVLTFVQVK